MCLHTRSRSSDVSYIKDQFEEYRACHQTGTIYICVLYICLHTAMYVSSFYYICVLILLDVCPHTAICVFIMLYMCPRTAICVLILLYMCPHTARWPFFAHTAFSLTFLFFDRFFPLPSFSCLQHPFVVATLRPGWKKIK